MVRVSYMYTSTKIMWRCTFFLPPYPSTLFFCILSVSQGAVGRWHLSTSLFINLMRPAEVSHHEPCWSSSKRVGPMWAHPTRWGPCLTVDLYIDLLLLEILCGHRIHTNIEMRLHWNANTLKCEHIEHRNANTLNNHWLVGLDSTSGTTP